MILSTQTTTKFTNTTKHENLNIFIDEYARVCQQFVDILWNLKEIPRLIPKNITNQVETWLSQRAIQAAAKQVSGIVRGTRQKQKQREFVCNQLIEANFLKRARKLLKIINKNKISKPNLENVNPELDSRFVKIDLDNQTSFDGWLTLSSLGNKLKIKIPFKKTQHFNKLLSLGIIKPVVRLSKNKLTFMFDIPDKEIQEGKVLGIDIGINNVFYASDGQHNEQDEDGWDLAKIQAKLSRRKKGSIGFRKAQTHRTNFVNAAINNLNLSEVSKIKIERIKHLRRNKSSSRFMSHWTYTNIFDKLELTCNLFGVQVEQINPTYTSQRCSRCGWVRKANRKGKMFKCTQCNFVCDADLNGSINISLELPAINRRQRLSHANRDGFYWHEAS